MLDLLLALVLMWKILFWSPPSRVLQKLSSSRNEVKLLGVFACHFSEYELKIFRLTIIMFQIFCALKIQLSFSLNLILKRSGSYT